MKIIFKFKTSLKFENNFQIMQILYCKAILIFHNFRFIKIEKLKYNKKNSTSKFN